MTTDRESFVNKLVQQILDANTLDEWEYLAGDMTTQPQAFLWNTIRDASYEDRTSLRRLFAQNYGIDEGGTEKVSRELLDQAESFNVFRTHKPPDSTWSHGYGTFALPFQAYGGRTEEETTKMLSLVTANAQIRGTKTPETTLTSRYTQDFLRKQSRHIVEGQQNNLLAGKKALVLDIETAGLSKHSGIWQLSARMVGDSGDADARVMNEVIRNRNMSYGIVPTDDGPLNLSTVFEKVAGRGGKVNESLLDVLENFADMVDEADYLAGQNISFDIEHLIYGIKAEIGRASPELAQKLERTVAKLTSDQVLDTQVLSEMVFGSEIGVSGRLKASMRYTPYSVENVMLQTNFLELWAKDEDWDTIVDTLRSDGFGTGAHDARVDTRVEAKLLQLQAEELERLGRGEAQRLVAVDEGFRDATRVISTLGDNTEVRLADLYDWIEKSQAVTPWTKTPEGILPFEFMLEQTRDLSTPLRDVSAGEVSEAFFESGRAKRWSDDMIGEEGRLTDADTLMFNEGNAKIGRTATELGLPTAGLSPIEQMINAQFSAISMDSGNIRSFAGDIMGSGMVRKTTGASAYSQTLAISPELLEDARLALPKSTIGKAVSADLHDLTMVRFSTVSKRQHDGTRRRGLAMVTDAFQSEEDIAAFRTFVKDMDEGDLKKYGLDKASREALLGGLSDDRAMRYGVQIGFAEGEQVNRFLDLVEGIGFGTDVSDESMRLVAASYQVEGQEGKLFSSPIMIEMGERGSLAADHGEQILERARRSRTFTEEGVNVLADDSVRRWAIGLTQERGRDVVREAYTFLKGKNLGRGALIGAGLGAGYYFMKGGEEQEPYDEAMSFGGYESDYTGRTPYEADLTFTDYPLRTANVVKRLDMSKIGHDQMGPNKYNHLYAGV